MADDLDDEWWLEDKGEKNENSSSDHEQVTEEEELSDGDEVKPDLKRKLADASDQEDEEDEKDGSDNDESQTEPTKKKKKRKRKKISEMLANEKPSPLFPHHMIESMDKHFKDKLSPVELDEVKIEEEHFTTCNDGTHTVASYLRFIVPKWKKIVTAMDASQHGAPLLLIICGSGIRAANLTRDLRNFSDGVKICKLFAKHIKLKDQIQFLNTRNVHIGIGTPNRIQALLDEGALKLEQVKYVVVDWSHRDVKFRRIGDIAEIRTDLYKLFSSHIISRVKAKQSKFALM